MNFIEKLKYYYKNGTNGVKIIYFSVMASFVFWLLKLIIHGTFFENIFLLSKNRFIPFVWTIFTFPFFHQDLFNLVFAMIMLYFSERIFLMYFNGSSFVKFFVLGSIFGGIIFLSVSYFTNSYGYLGGAILGIYSVLFAIISYNPKMEVSLFPLPFRFPIYVLGLILIGLDFLSLKDYAANFFMARLGAAVFGFLYMKPFEKGNDFLGKFVPDFDTIENWFSKKSAPKFKIEPNENPQATYYSEQRTRPKTDEEFNVEKKENQKKIDEILDKISKYGYDKLTQEEKDFLFKQK
ncbi:MAG: rhomboid family intramembrane serine protease [Flavobacteriaceae bacterium]|jgi:membrane associated rhomboid family serine protease|nr:rhomboid family intramembrane serine protease [Flavobacteriaceae bacterium]